MDTLTLRTFLDAKLDTYMGMLKQLVDINSYTDNPAGVNAVADVTAQFFADMGFTAESIPSSNPDFGNHLILSRPGTTATKIGCISHLDTVFPAEDEVANNFHWRVEGDKIYGPGTNDIKGGTIGIYMMLDALRTYAPEQFEAVNWQVLFDASEERAGHQFGAICRQRLEGGAAALVFELGHVEDNTFGMLVKRKGMATYKVTVQGRASHAGSQHPHGASAIVQMADVIQKIAGFTDYDRELTFNVGRVEGGTVPNRIPHECTAAVEMRAYDGDVFDDGLNQILALNRYSSVSSQDEDAYRCKVRVQVLKTMQPWQRNGGSDKLCGIWQAAADELGYTVVPTWRGGLSDANFIFDVLPTLDALGPYGANAHCSEQSADGTKEQEFVYRSSFVPKTVLNTVAILKLIEQA